MRRSPILIFILCLSLFAVPAFGLQADSGNPPAEESRWDGWADAWQDVLLKVRSHLRLPPASGEPVIDGERIPEIDRVRQTSSCEDDSCNGYPSMDPDG